jgi:transglutaminase-like putative cysteine protease
MKFRVLHSTRYQYQLPVADSFNEVRLQPANTDHQKCESFLLKVLPSTRLSHFTDFYSNYTHFFEIPEPHNELLIESTSTISTSPKAPPAPDAQVAPLDQLGQCASMDLCYDFLQPSHYIELSPDIWRLALDAAASHSDAWGAAQAIMRYVHANFSYVPNVTNVHTRVGEVLHERCGVCQDFAHLMLALCRSIKIPARYVSGYLYNGPREQLKGAQASHAWCEVYLPGHGWQGLDPTNNQPVNESYVRIGAGRDYHDVPPVRGHYKGTQARTLTVNVLVECIDR